MGFVMTLMLGSLVLSLLILFYPPPLGERRPWLLRTSWALWTIQPVLFLGSLIASLAYLDRSGYNSDSLPSDMEAWFGFAMIGPVGAALLAGTVLGGLAWRAARVEQPPTSRRWWALAATIACMVWFGGGAWLFVAGPVAIALDVLILVVGLGVLLWPQRTELPTAPPAPPVEQEHLVG